MKKTVKKNVKETTFEGLLITKTGSDNLKHIDFECVEDVEVKGFVGRFKVQGMHDGNLYMEELPKRVRNKPLYRLDNSSLSLTKNGFYYFVFRMAESEASVLPQQLVSEARQMARIVKRDI